MTIEINGLPGGPLQNTGANTQIDSNSSSNQVATQTGNSNSSDKVSLTSSATQLQALEEKISNLPEIDTQRVAEVRQSMATGSYEANHVNAANNMLAIERAFTQ